MIKTPIKLWSGHEDVFSPASHTYWLAQHIKQADLEVEPGKVHFRSVEVLPRILAWVVDEANWKQRRGRPAMMAGA